MAIALQSAPTWKRVLGGALDFLTVFVGVGYVIAKLTGGITPEGFWLDDLPAFILVGVVIGYFVVSRKVLGGSIWDRILGIPRG